MEKKPANSEMTQNQVLHALQRYARLHTRVDHEADDLLQEVLLIAVNKKRDITDPGFVAWAKGAIRNHARFMARTAGRRRKREASWEPPCSDSQSFPRFSLAFLSTLPPAQRIVAHLVNLGLNRTEIVHLLGLNDAAFRQRLAGLCKAFKRHNQDIEFPITPIKHHGGLARRSLKQSLRFDALRGFAIRDPDGIPLFFSRHDHNSRSRGN
jgi:RNA polymerase sigma-70 factor (ECF subfamily)